MDKKSPEPILVVDDEKPILDTISRAFRKDRIQVLTALNAEQGINLIEKSEAKPKVVISDHKMPGMSGLEFLSWLKQHYPEMVRILLTGYGDMDSAKLAINQGGVFKYLEKPWQESELKEVIWEGIKLSNQLQAKPAEDGLKQRLKELEQELARFQALLSRTEQEKEQLSRKMVFLNFDLLKIRGSNQSLVLSNSFRLFLNNYLTSILLNAQVLARNYTQVPELYQGLETIKVQAQKCKDLLLDLGQIGQGFDYHSVQDRVDLNQTILNIFYFLSPLFRSRNIILELDLAQTLGTICLPREVMEPVIFEVLLVLHQVFENGGRVIIRTGCKLSKELSLEFQTKGAGLKPDKKLMIESLANSSLISNFKYLTDSRLILSNYDSGLNLVFLIPFPIKLIK